MTDTRDKLSEAEYFFDCMKCYDAKPEVFRYNLSAFLCAFRSILWIMRAEFLRDLRAKQKELQFEAWWETQEVRICQDAKVVLLCNVRDENIHERPTQLARPVESQSRVKLTIREDASLDIIYNDGSIQRIDFPSSSEDILRSPETVVSSSCAQSPLRFSVTQDLRKRITGWINEDKKRKEALKNKGIGTNPLLLALFKDIDTLVETPATEICQDGLSTLQVIASDCEQRFPI